MITVHTVTFNEEVLMQFMIDHYRTRFPNCHIVVYDNQSTDKTVEIAKSNECELRYFNTGGKCDDMMFWKLKDNCWRNAKTDWVLVCDLDELLDINEAQLKQEEANGVTKIKSICWQMINMQDNFDIKNIKHGYRYRHKDGSFNTVYDKDLLFNKKYITDIGYTGGGCHSTNSKGIVKNSKPYRLLHYKYVHQEAWIAKQNLNYERRCDINLKYGWGMNHKPNDDAIREEFKFLRANAEKILD